MHIDVHTYIIIYLSASDLICIACLAVISSMGNTAVYLQHTATHCNTLQHTATHCNTLQHTTYHDPTCRTSNAQLSSIPWGTLQHNTTNCNKLQHTATHYNMRHTRIRLVIHRLRGCRHFHRESSTLVDFCITHDGALFCFPI